MSIERDYLKLLHARLFEMMVKFDQFCVAWGGAGQGVYSVG